MIGLLSRARAFPGCRDPLAAERAELRRRITRLRRDVQALQTRADALYGAPDGEWSDPEAAPHA